MKITILTTSFGSSQDNIEDNNSPYSATFRGPDSYLRKKTPNIAGTTIAHSYAAYADAYSAITYWADNAYAADAVDVS